MWAHLLFLQQDVQYMYWYKIHSITLGAITWLKLLSSIFCLITDRQTKWQAENDAYEPNVQREQAQKSN